MFEGFTLDRIDVGDVVLRVRHGGSGPPVLLLHGHPRTHATWARVAPLLAGRFTVVCPDLRGYGESAKPATTPDHASYSKRAMAGNCVALMRALGHERFCLAGHDRGTYVAQRLAFDSPGSVRRLCLMEGIPVDAYRRSGSLPEMVSSAAAATAPSPNDLPATLGQPAAGLTVGDLFAWRTR